MTVDDTTAATADAVEPVFLPGLHDHLASLDWSAGLALVVTSMLLLFFGWRLVVLTFTIGTGVTLGLLTLTVVGRLAGASMAWISAAVALFLGLIIGRWLHRMSRAIATALLLGLLAALPGVAAEEMLIGVAVGVVAALIGFVLGWVYARHVEAIATTIAGGQILATGLYVIIAPHVAHGTSTAIAVLGGAAAAVMGLRVQFSDLRGDTPRPRRREHDDDHDQ